MSTGIYKRKQRKYICLICKAEFFSIGTRCFYCDKCKKIHQKIYGNEYNQRAETIIRNKKKSKTKDFKRRKAINDKKYRKTHLEEKKEYCKKYYLEHKEIIKIRTKKWEEENPKKVRINSKKSARNYRDKNKEKMSQQSKIYYQKNKEHKKVYSRKYYQEHIEKIRKCAINYVKNNKDKINKKRREKINNNSKLKIRYYVSSRIRDRLKVRLASKNGKSTFDFLPYTVDDLMQHLESLFESWMSWSNYGARRGYWTIDHKLPDSSFNYTSVEDEEFQKCWALKNLQPMEYIENIRKSNKISKKYNNI